MGYKSLRHAAKDLEKNGHLIRIRSEVDPNLEMAEIHRRIFDKGGPAILFESVKGSPFQAISNIYGTIDRTRFLFRHDIEQVKRIIELKIDPIQLAKKPFRYMGSPFFALNGLPKRAWFSKPIKYGKTTIDQLPQIKSWPMDGGAFVTLPQVFTLGPGETNMMKSNLGMYRIQLSGNEYIPNEEIGLHYQLHRGIGVHHTAYNDSKEPFRASVFVGGPPSHAFAAIMPLPEGLSELTFAGLLNSRAFRYIRHQGHVLSAQADFCIVGTVIKGQKKREGPFGDHLGYYSLDHDFPLMKVDAVYHRKDPLWHFTVVGRPPAEDSSFGYLIHELVKELAPSEFPGLIEVNAVDAAGVHPLLLAIGSERYMPFRDKKPEEILTIANHLLGKGQTTLAKFLIIADIADDPNLSTHHIADFFQHVLRRIDWKRDLHFQTKTTMDTLDYSGDGWNGGSKVVMACCGEPIRKLADQTPEHFTLHESFPSWRVAMPGILLIQAQAWSSQKEADLEMANLTEQLSAFDLSALPLVVVCDDASFTANTLNNFLWVTFTRANPSHDIYGVHSFTEYKHWGCQGSLVIDARIKKHHAPALVTDDKVSERVDRLFKKGGELHGII